MNLFQLRAFHAVATHGTFSAAALALGVSQPAVTQHVKAFEEALGARLFHRGVNGVELTANGQDLLPQARRALFILDEIGAQVDEGRALRQGRLSLGICAPFVVMPLIRHFMAAHPGIALDVRLENSARLLDLVAGHRIDIAVATLTEARPDLLCEPITSQRVLVVVPVGHPWQQQASLAPGDLAGQGFILREEGSMTRHLFERGLAAEGVSIVERLTLASREAVKEAVAAGLGPGIVLDQELGFDPRLVGIPVEVAAMTAQEAVIVQPDLAEFGAIRAFREIAHELAALGPYRDVTGFENGRPPIRASTPYRSIA